MVLVVALNSGSSYCVWSLMIYLCSSSYYYHSYLHSNRSILTDLIQLYFNNEDIFLRFWKPIRRYQRFYWVIPQEHSYQWQQLISCMVFTLSFCQVIRYFDDDDALTVCTYVCKYLCMYVAC